jgi:hypothetical protein
VQDTAAGGDGTVPDDDAVYRRLSDSGPNMVSIDVGTGLRRPSSGAFKPDEDGVSVYRDSVLRAAGLSPVDLVRAPQNLVVIVTVSDVRSIPPLDVRDDPWPPSVPDAGHPRNGAHALIVGWDGLSTSERKRRQREIVRLPSMRFVHPRTGSTA